MKQHVVSVFFDLLKVYDAIGRYGIIRTLHSYGLRGNVLLFIQSFVQDRTFWVRVGTALSRPFTREESVLSITLFGLASNDVSCLPRDIHCTFYVDDFSMHEYYDFPRVNVAESHINTCSSDSLDWLSWVLILTQENCHDVFFAGKKFFSWPRTLPVREETSSGWANAISGHDFEPSSDLAITYARPQSCLHKMIVSPLCAGPPLLDSWPGNSPSPVSLFLFCLR